LFLSVPKKVMRYCEPWMSVSGVYEYEPLETSTFSATVLVSICDLLGISILMSTVEGSVETDWG